jgi:hypothetical protein
LPGIFYFQNKGELQVSDHKVDRERVARQRFVMPEKPKHPLGWACENCFHVVKDTTPNSIAMKCCRYPPDAQALNMGGGAMQVMAISPPVQLGEWCGEYAIAPPVLNA